PTSPPAWCGRSTPWAVRYRTCSRAPPSRRSSPPRTYPDRFPARPHPLLHEQDGTIMSTETSSNSPLETELRFDAVDLAGRIGSHRTVQHTITAPARDAGGQAMQVPEGETIDVEAELESVVEGIYVHGTVTTHLEGECSRCLDPVEQDIGVRIDELFMYPEKLTAEEKEDAVLFEDDQVDPGRLVRDTIGGEAAARGRRGPARPGRGCPRCLAPVEQDIAGRIDELFMYPEKLTAEEKEDAVLFEDDQVDLGPLVRDTIGVEADERPLCRPDCPGLCSQCGFRMEDDPEHFHDVIDPRFAALQGLLEEDSDDVEQAEDSSEQPGSSDDAREKEDR